MCWRTIKYRKFRPIHVCPYNTMAINCPVIRICFFFVFKKWLVGLQDFIEKAEEILMLLMIRILMWFSWHDFMKMT